MKKTINIRKWKDIALCAGCALALLGAVGAISAAFFNKTDNLSETREIVKIDDKKTLNEWLELATSETLFVMAENMELETANMIDTTIEAEKGQTVIVDGRDHTLVIKGTGNGAIQITEESTLILKNMTIEDETTGGVYSDYLGFSGNIAFVNCTINDPLYLMNAVNANFVNCTITCDLPRHYAIWVSDGFVAFEGCTFTGTRALKIHEFDAGNKISNVFVNNCTFDRLTEKVGVVIGNLTFEPKNTVIEVKDSKFNECLAWDNIGSLEGVDGFWESDTPIDEFDFRLSDNTVTFTPTTYKIVYHAVYKDDILNIDQSVFVNGNNLPDHYNYGETTVLGLKGIIYSGRYEEVEFIGWYLDRECKIAFDCVIDAGQRGHIVLYAKVEIGMWTGFY